LHGLEAVELKLSEATKDNITFRFDSEYFKKEYLRNDKKISDNYRILDFLQDEKILNIKSLFLNKNFHYLSIADLDLSNGFQYQTKDMDYLNIIDRATYVLQNKDIVISTIRPNRNAVGFIKNEKRIVGTSGFAVLRTKKIRSEFLYIFCKTKYFITCLNRETTATMYPAVTDGDIFKTKIINPSNGFQTKIEALVKLSYQKLQESKALYRRSEELLLDELGLTDFEPSKEKIAIKSFKESFGDSGRLDSEYYQPKYDDIIDRIKSKRYNSLNNIVNINKSVEPGSEAYQDNGIPFIRVSNLTKFGLSEPSIHLSETLFDKEALEKLQPKKDTILLSKDGTVGIAYNIKKYTKIITSGAILHLTIKDDKVLPEYLTLVLNSLVVQMQSQRDAGGSIIKHWKPSEIGEVLIPIIDNTIQLQIEEKIKESFKLKEQSKELLEVAKTAVEIAIEDGEYVGLEYITNSAKENPNND